MMSLREPTLKPVAIADLRPTQMTVGVREVKEKRKRWRDESKRNGAEFLGKHMIPVVLGPEDRHYVIDHHHLARALHDEGVEDVLVTVVKNLRTLEPDSFWFVLDNHSWMHAYDDEGRLRPYEDLPKTVAGLVDDPFRSLAGELRRAGGFAKDTTPFSEFLWADFLRRRVKRKTVELSPLPPRADIVSQFDDVWKVPPMGTSDLYRRVERLNLVALQSIRHQQVTSPSRWNYFFSPVPVPVVVPGAVFIPVRRS